MFVDWLTGCPALVETIISLPAGSGLLPEAPILPEGHPLQEWALWKKEHRVQAAERVPSPYTWRARVGMAQKGGSRRMQEGEGQYGLPLASLWQSCHTAGLARFSDSGSG